MVAAILMEIIIAASRKKRPTDSVPYKRHASPVVNIRTNIARRTATELSAVLSVTDKELSRAQRIRQGIRRAAEKAQKVSQLSAVTTAKTRLDLSFSSQATSFEMVILPSKRDPSMGNESVIVSARRVNRIFGNGMKNKRIGENLTSN
jgi:hypothetical protein